MDNGDPPTEQEIEHAVAIREAALKDPQLALIAQEMTDLQYIQHAVCAKEKVDTALRRIRTLQDFKDRYGILSDGSYEQGLRDVQACQRFFPRMLLAMGQDGPASAVVYAMDLAQYDARKLVSEEAHAVVMRTFFYLLQAGQSNVVAMRQGIRVVANYEGLGWHQFSLSGEQRSRQLYSRCYPMRVREMAMMQAHPLVRLLYRLLKPFMSPKVAQVFCCPPHRQAFLEAHADVYPPTVLPTAWGGRLSPDQWDKRFAHKLRERYHNAAHLQCLPPTNEPE